MRSYLTAYLLLPLTLICKLLVETKDRCMAILPLCTHTFSQSGFHGNHNACLDLPLPCSHMHTFVFLCYSALWLSDTVQWSNCMSRRDCDNNLHHSHSDTSVEGSRSRNLSRSCCCRLEQGSTTRLSVPVCSNSRDAERIHHIHWNSEFHWKPQWYHCILSGWLSEVSNWAEDHLTA